jgi:two-component system sensor histidine kinase YesM
VGEMIYSLGSLFQYTVKQETIVTLEEEIENCRRFLELYRIRYKYRINYHIEIDSKLKECPVLKLTVQPLIENIIVHGIRQSSSTNMISIFAVLDEDTSTLRIVVEDNGKGIEPEKLLAIQESFAKTEAPFSSTSLGLRNVNERIRLQYGESYGLSIESQLQERTVVCLRIPFQKTGVKHIV